MVVDGIAVVDNSQSTTPTFPPTTKSAANYSRKSKEPPAETKRAGHRPPRCSHVRKVMTLCLGIRRSNAGESPRPVVGYNEFFRIRTRGNRRGPFCLIWPSTAKSAKIDLYGQ